jgi:peptidoglycan-associated lipoprotein
MNQLHRHVLTLLAAAALAACSSVKLDEPPVESRTGTPVGAGTGAGANAGGTAQTRVAPVDVTSTSNAAFSNLPRIVYFDFDSYVVKDDYRPVIEANGKALAADRKRHVTVEGHTDDRGSSEYNLALGQRRAEAVKKVMTVLGVNDNRIETVSYGEEKPKSQGHDEQAWAENRRADIRYQGE